MQRRKMADAIEARRDVIYLFNRGTPAQDAAISVAVNVSSPSLELAAEPVATPTAREPKAK